MSCGCKKKTPVVTNQVQLPPMSVDLSITETQIQEPQQPVSEDQTQQMMETVVKISETNL
jgi:hypothetical protein